MLRNIKNIIHNYKIQKKKKKRKRKLGINIGENCRILSKNFGSEPYLITIGDNTTISMDVEFITHDGAVHVLRNLYEEYKNIDIIKPINIGKNCFIGGKTTILHGVTIGDNTIIGAGSVVTKDIPANVVAAGVPAKQISTLEDYISRNKKDFIYTKHMSQSEKKQYLMSLYDIILDKKS